MNLETTEKTKKNDSGKTIVTDRYKTSDTVIDGTIMTGTEMIEARTITTIGMIMITPPVIIGGEMTNGETMWIRIGINKDIGPTDASLYNKKRNNRKEECEELAKDYQREPHRSIIDTQMEQRKTEEPNLVVSSFQLGNMPKANSSNTWKVYCYYCRQDGHYNNQCLVKTNKEKPAINMVVAEVADIQQVTT